MLSCVRSHRYLSLRAALLLCVVARISRATPYSAVQHAPPVSSGFILFLCRGPGFGYYTALSLRTAMAHIYVHAHVHVTCVCPSGHSAHCRRVSDTTHRASNTKLSFIRIRTFIRYFAIFIAASRGVPFLRPVPFPSRPRAAAAAWRLCSAAGERRAARRASAARRRVTSVHSRERMPASSPAHEPPHQPPTRAHHRRPRRL